MSLKKIVYTKNVFNFFSEKEYEELGKKAGFKNISFDSIEDLLNLKMPQIKTYLVMMNTEGGIKARIDENSQFIMFEQEEETLTEFDKQIQQFCLDVKKLGEDAKVAIRNIRRDANDSFKKLSKSRFSIVVFENRVKTGLL